MMVEIDCRFGKLQSSAQPIRDTLIEETVRSMDISMLMDLQYRSSIIPDFLNRYDEWIRSSTLNSITGLDRYGRYMTFAVTHAIEQFLMNHRDKRIRTFKGEYPGTMELIRGYDLNHSTITVDDISSGDAVIVSAPFSGSGNRHPMMDEILDSCQRIGVPVMIDAAFFGVCKNLNLRLHECVEVVAFSLSKCYYMNTHRTGMAYSTNPPAGIEVLHRFGYTSRFGAAIAMGLFDKFGPDYSYHKYSGIQAEVCDALGDVTPSDTVLFGNGGELWKDFSRGGGNNRISFGDFLPEMWEEREGLRYAH